MKQLLIAALLAAGMGCAVTTIKYKHVKPNGESIEGSYTSGKNIKAEIATNGTLSIVASASEATDANTRLLKQATESVLAIGAVAK